MTFDTDSFNKANDAARAVALTTIGEGRRYRQQAINHLLALPEDIRQDALALLMDYAQTVGDLIDTKLKQAAESPQNDEQQDDGHE